MAEFVQQSIEQMLPELEEMVRIKLFTQHETRAILKKRKAHEYRMRRRTKEKQDFLQYVQYEINVLALVRKRRAKYDIQHKKLEIDLAMVQRIHSLFRMVCHRFQDDVNLWLSHIQFAKNRGERSTTSRLMLRMLQVHTRKPELWIMAAKWEFEMNKSTENARSLFQRGLRFNPESRLLWLEYYRMELLNVDKLKKRRQILGIDEMESGEETIKQEDAVIEGKIADIVFTRAVDAFPDDADFCLSFLPVCSLFNFTNKMQKEMLEVLEARFTKSEAFWKIVAMREGDAFLKEKRAGTTAVFDLECRKSSVLEKACNELKTEKMWTVLIQFWLGRIGKKSSQGLRGKRVEKCLNAISRADELQLSDMEMRMERIKLLSLLDRREDVKRYCELLTCEYPAVARVWTLRIQNLILDKAAADLVVDLFTGTVKKLTSSDDEDGEWLRLWEVIVTWLSESEYQYLKSLFELGLRSKLTSVVLFCKSKYLDYTASSFGMKSTRKLFMRLLEIPPVDKDIFQQYIRLECEKEKPKVGVIREAFEQCVDRFGENDVDLWIEYIEFERNLGRQSYTCADALRESDIHWKALRGLRAGLSDDFAQKYALLSAV